MRPPDDVRAVARGGVQVVLARGAFYAVACVAALLLARGLGPVQYGVYGVVISVLVLIEQVAQSTLAPAAANLIPEGDIGGRLAGTTFVLSCSLFTVLFVATWLAAPLVDRLLGLDGGGFFLRVAALDLPVFGAYVASRGICQGHRKFLAIALAESAYVAAKAVGLLALLYVGFSVVSALAINVAATVAGFLLLVPHVLPLVRRWNLAAGGSLLTRATRFGFYMLALQTLGGIDLWILAPFTEEVDPAGLGVYVAARTVAVVPSLILVAVWEVLLPSLSKALADGDPHLARRYLAGAVRFIWIALVPITALVFLTGQEVMTLLFSDQYATGGTYVGLLAASSGLFALVVLLGTALNASGQSAVAALALLAVSPLAVVLNLALVPAYGPAGAAAARMITALVAASAIAIAAYRRFGAFVRVRTLAVGSLATVVIALLAAPIHVSGFLVLVYYGAGLALYGILLVVLRELRRDDLATVWDGLGLPALSRND